MREAAFTHVYREHVEFVWRFARSLGVDEAHLDDVVHEVFLVVRRRLATRDEAAPLRGWLARITRHVVLHHHRSRAREAKRIESVAPPSAPRGPDDELDVVEAAALMQTFLDGLDAAKREVYALVEIEGMSVPEVAALIGAKLPTVYTRLRAARFELAGFVARLRDGSPAIARGGRHGAG
jgi:RNA polymerase sigma-70 factor (ECF subfamily)